LQSKLVVLKSLSTFLTHAVSRLLRSPSDVASDRDPTAVSLPTWFFAPSFLSARSFTAYERLYHSEPADVQPQLNVDHLQDDFICMPDFVTGASTIACSFNDLSDLSLAHTESLTHPSHNTSSLIVRH
jgi:pre-rRNA-processing protein IPI1